MKINKKRKEEKDTNSKNGNKLSEQHYSLPISLINNTITIFESYGANSSLVTNTLQECRQLFYYLEFLTGLHLRRSGCALLKGVSQSLFCNAL
jgi:hypothetical protein